MCVTGITFPFLEKRGQVVLSAGHTFLEPASHLSCNDYLLDNDQRAIITADPYLTLHHLRLGLHTSVVTVFSALTTVMVLVSTYIPSSSATLFLHTYTYKPHSSTPQKTRKRRTYRPRPIAFLGNDGHVSAAVTIEALKDSSSEWRSIFRDGCNAVSGGSGKAWSGCGGTWFDGTTLC